MRRAAAYFAALTAAVLLSAILAGSASAADYSVYSCAGPTNESLPNDAWTPRLSVPSHASAFTFSGSCPSLTVSATALSSLAAGENVGYGFDAPSGTSIAGYVIRRSATVDYAAGSGNPTLSAGLRRTVNSVNTYWGECESVTADCSFNAATTQSAGLDASSLQVGVECAQSASACAPNKFNVLRATLISSRVDLKDNSVPALATTGGTLLNVTGTGTVRTLALVATDIGGGVKSVDLAVDGVNLASANSGGACTTPFTVRVPCPLTTPANLQLNVGALAVGLHTAVPSVTDAAGNITRIAPITFNVGEADIVKSASANGSPAVEKPSLLTSKRLIDGRASTSVAVRGALRTPDGNPVSGARLDVFSVDIGFTGGATKPLGSVKTGTDGRFVFKIKPRGAQQLTFSFRPRAGAAETAAASTIVRERLALSARGSGRALSVGRALTISGRIRGTNGAAAGLPVEIQVALGKQWRTVDTVTSSKSGSYKWVHRFKRVTRPTIFRFRAVVRGKKSWPWPTKTSSSVQVLVRG
jgi:hypothetical protein